MSDAVGDVPSSEDGRYRVAVSCIVTCPYGGHGVGVVLERVQDALRGVEADGVMISDARGDTTYLGLAARDPFRDPRIVELGGHQDDGE